MDNRSCGECGKLRSEECKQPDYCVSHGYSNFSKASPFKKCDCGGQIHRIRTTAISDTFFITDLLCMSCGQAAEERREKVLKKKSG